MNANKHDARRRHGGQLMKIQFIAVGEIIFAIATTVGNSTLQPKIFDKNGNFTEKLQKLFQTDKEPKTLQS